jgi:hypothetical protein
VRTPSRSTLSPRERAGTDNVRAAAISLGERHLRFEVKLFLMYYGAASGVGK